MKNPSTPRPALHQAQNSKADAAGAAALPAPARTSAPRRTQAQRNAETRAALIAAARRIFGETGFAAAATEEIVAAAGVSRGALYHHFADKTALFAAVAELCQQEVLAAIEAAAGRQTTPRAALEAGAIAFIHASLAEDRRRILLIDGQAALGPAAWRALDQRHGVGALCAGLIAAGLKPADAEAGAILLSGAMNDAALSLAERGESKALARRLEALLCAMIGAVLPTK